MNPYRGVRTLIAIKPLPGETVRRILIPTLMLHSGIVDGTNLYVKSFQRFEARFFKF